MKRFKDRGLNWEIQQKEKVFINLVLNVHFDPPTLQIINF
jgi:hypothetical protein